MLHELATAVNLIALSGNYVTKAKIFIVHQQLVIIMTQATTKDSQEQILRAFEQLLAERKKAQLKVATKEEEAQKEKNQGILEEASSYTVDNIVNGMASLQLDFGNIINELSQRLTTEVTKLDQIKQAITVETDQLAQIKKVRLVADTLHILRQEHQEKIRILESRTAEEQETIEKEREQTRKAWEKQQEEFELNQQEYGEILAQEREQQEADYQYEIERDRQMEMDEYEEGKRLQERELAEAGEEKEKDWANREKFLADNQELFTENQQKVAGFEEELKQAYTKAKGDAIKEAERKAKVEADLTEKGWEAAKQGFDLKVASLESTIERQREEVAELMSQLQTANTQAQSLAMRAFQSSADRN